MTNWYNNDIRPGRENHPVNFVSSIQASEYCEWLGARLPSESEWEYAASSQGRQIGGKTIEYPWGNEPATCDYAVKFEYINYNSIYGCGTGHTLEVCSKPLGHSDQGLCDMAGNVNEWVEDRWHLNYDLNDDGVADAPDDGSAWINDEHSHSRVQRSGCWGTSVVRVSYRSYHYDAWYRDEYIGFRCARDLP